MWKALLSREPDALFLLQVVGSGHMARRENSDQTVTGQGLDSASLNPDYETQHPLAASIRGEKTTKTMFLK